MERPVNIYKIEMMVIDFDNIGEESVKQVIESTRYPNHCISPNVKSIETRQVDWRDDHPLNKKSTCDDYYRKMFSLEFFEVAKG